MYRSTETLADLLHTQNVKKKLSDNIKWTIYSAIHKTASLRASQFYLV